MTIAGPTLVILVLAAVLEVGGDAAIRHGLARSAWPIGLLGAAALVAYGFVINANRDCLLAHYAGESEQFLNGLAQLKLAELSMAVRVARVNGYCPLLPK